MSELVTAAPPGSAVSLPPAPPLPKLVQGLGFAMSRRFMMRRLSRRYGSVFTLKLPMWGPVVAVSDPQLAKQIFTTSPDELGNIQPNLSRLFGHGSVFGLEGDDHRRRRRLLAPPFHGKSMNNYESIIEEETLRDSADWPEGEPFATLAPMMRITLNAILRAVFGADGAELDELRRLLPPWVTLGSRLAALPKPKRTWPVKPVVPAGRVAAPVRQRHRHTDRGRAGGPELRRPGRRARTAAAQHLRRWFGHVTQGYWRRAAGAAGRRTRDHRVDPGLGVRADQPAPADTRRPGREADDGGNELRQATILEVQRARTVIDFAGRHVYPATYQLGDWTIPRGYSIIIRIAQIHDNPEVFPDPGRFDPQCFVTTKPSALSWIPFGGGTRRCVGGGIRQHGDGCGASNGIAPLHYRDHQRARRALALPRGGIHPEARWPDGNAQTLSRSAARQLPAGTDVVAGVPAGIALQVVLVLGFGLPEVVGGTDLGHDLAGP